MKVLHVVESFGGGVVTALLSYVEATPELDHYLLRKERTESLSLDKELERAFVAVHDLPSSFADARVSVKQMVSSLDPTVVHAHSSLAGAIVRTAIRANARSIVYTPHCYAFERKDVPFIARMAFKMAEKVLARNTTVVAACSARELELAGDLRRSQTAVHVPNASTPKNWSLGTRNETDGGSPTIIGVGRLSTQKDPEFFAAVIEAVNKETPVRGIWIGDGEAVFRQSLVAAGVHITGWVTEDEVFQTLSTADVYVHSAKWEGMPLSLLEANGLGLPLIVRRVESMSWVPQAQGAETVEEISHLIIRLITDNKARQGNRAAWESILGNNTFEEQRRSLLESYGYMEYEMA